MIHQELLRRAVPQDDLVLQSFVEHLAPPILTYMASVPALGGSGKPPVIEGLEIPAGLRVYTAQDYARLTKGGKQEDQSMATHLLNGIFAAMRLAKRLPPNKQLTDLDKRLWILGYICHDYTKIYGIQISAGEIPLIKQLIEQLGALMNFDAFLPEWRDYLGDIAFLAQNTQTKEGSNLQVEQFQPKHDLRRLNNVLRTLSSIADILVHIKSPAEIAIALQRSTDQNLREKMVSLFGAEQTPRFTYHKLTEVRGLLSNIINNAVMNVLQAQGAEPFLFFPNGVVYVTNRDDIFVDKEEISTLVWDRMVEILVGSSTETPGDDEDGFELGYDKLKGILKLPDIVITLYDYDPWRLLKAGIPACMKFAATSAQNRLEKIGKGSINLPNDRRVNQLGMFLHYIDGILANKLFPEADQISERLLEVLGVSDVITVQEAKQQKGGSPYGWFYTAATFIARHKDIDPAGLIEIMSSIAKEITQSLMEQNISTRRESIYRRSMLDYVQRSIETYLLPNAVQRFVDELLKYVSNKSHKKHVCSLCSSPYTAFKQETKIALFLVQQYSNKNPLGGSNKRGICPICTVELMLRQVQQQAKNERGENFQEQKPIYFWIYPTYFFTTETASVIKEYIRELRDLFVPELRRHLQKNGFTVSSLLDFDGFIIQKDDDHAWSIIRQKYDEHDMAGLFSFAVKPLGKKPSDTDAWIVPAFHALFLPLLLDVKVVATPSFVPLFASGAEFAETAVLDAPHQFTRYALDKDRFRVDELPEAVIRLLRLYDLHLDVFGDGNWGQINGMVKDLVTNPYYVFYYLEHKKRKENLPEDYLSRETINRYLQIYQAFGGTEDMGLVGKIVSAYAEFYEPKWDRRDSAYAVLKPLLEAADTIVASDPKTDKETLIELVSGAVGELMQRVWANNADGRDPLVMTSSDVPRSERVAQSMEKQAEFVRFFVEEVFYGYCNGDRGALREKMSVIRGAARFEYARKFANKPKE